MWLQKHPTGQHLLYIIYIEEAGIQERLKMTEAAAL